MVYVDGRFSGRPLQNNNVKSPKTATIGERGQRWTFFFVYRFGSKHSLRTGSRLRLGQKEVVNIKKKKKKKNGRRAGRAA